LLLVAAVAEVQLLELMVVLVAVALEDLEKEENLQILIQFLHQMLPEVYLSQQQHILLL